MQNRLNVRAGALLRLGTSLAVVVALLLAPSAEATQVALPNGARWFVTAPNAARFARDAAAFLSSAAELAPALSPTRMNAQAVRNFGIGLLQEDALEAAGVDATQPWMLFERGGAQYLAVGVKDRAKLAATLDQWGQSRLLHQRDEQKVDRPRGATMVTFSRAAGSRAAAGYLITDDRAIILIQPADRTPALVAAYQALDGAAPVQSGVDGTLLVWLGNETALRDGWIAIVARQDGIDLAGEARKIDAGFVEKGSGHGDWVRSVTGSQRSADDVPVWVRLLAGPKTGAQLISAFAPLLNDSLNGAHARPWLDSLKTLSAGPLEVLMTSVDVRTVENAEGGGMREDMLRLMHPSIVFADRPAASVAASLKAATPALCSAKPEGEDAIRAMCSDPAMTVGRMGQGLFVGWTGAVSKPAIPQRPGGSLLSCAKGTPIAAGRVNLAVVGDALNEVGFLGAMSSQSLAGLLAIGSEYGRLMRASAPAVGLACLESSGHVTLQGRWRFAPRQQ